MAEPARGLAMFSTKLGRFQYKAARRSARCIIRSDYWDDVHFMAQSLQNEFPQQCGCMTMREVQRIDDYFDPLDIQMQSRTFLIHVLELLVCWNALDAVQKVNQFAQSWKEGNLEAYDSLAFNAKIEDVFSKQDIDEVRCDILDSALNLLVKWKYPEGWEIAVEDYRLKMASHEGQEKFLQLSWLAESAMMDEQPPRRSASDPLIERQDVQQKAPFAISGPPASAPLYAPPIPPFVGIPQLHSNVSSSLPPEVYPVNLPPGVELHSDIRPKFGQNMTLSQYGHYHDRHISQAIQSLANMPLGRPLEPPNELLERIHPGSTSRGDFHSDPVTTAWRDKVGYSKNIVVLPSQGRPGPFEHRRVPLAARPRGFPVSNLPRGVRNPPKRKSDDIRRHEDAQSVYRQPSDSDQVKWVRAPPINFQIDFRCPPASVPSRTNSLVSESATASGALRYAPPMPTLNHRHVTGENRAANNLRYPKPGNFRPEPEWSNIRHSIASIRDHNSRLVTNPFPGSANKVVYGGKTHPEIRPQDLESLETNASNINIRQADMFTKRYFGPQNNLDAPGHYSASDPPLDDRQHGGMQIAQPINHGPQRENSKRHRPIRSHESLEDNDNCELYILGFPTHFDVFAVRDLLEPCRGLLETTEPRPSKSQLLLEVAGQKWVFARFASHELAAEAFELLPRTRFSDVNGGFLFVSWKDPRLKSFTPRHGGEIKKREIDHAASGSGKKPMVQLMSGVEEIQRGQTSISRNPPIPKYRVPAPMPKSRHRNEHEVSAHPQIDQGQQAADDMMGTVPMTTFQNSDLAKNNLKENEVLRKTHPNSPNTPQNSVLLDATESSNARKIDSPLDQLRAPAGEKTLKFGGSETHTATETGSPVMKKKRNASKSNVARTTYSSQKMEKESAKSPQNSPHPYEVTRSPLQPDFVVEDKKKTLSADPIRTESRDEEVGPRKHLPVSKSLTPPTREVSPIDVGDYKAISLLRDHRHEGALESASRLLGGEPSRNDSTSLKLPFNEVGQQQEAASTVPISPYVPDNNNGKNLHSPAKTKLAQVNGSGSAAADGGKPVAAHLDRSSRSKKASPQKPKQLPQTVDGMADSSNAGPKQVITSSIERTDPLSTRLMTGESSSVNRGIQSLSGRETTSLASQQSMPPTIRESEPREDMNDTASKNDFQLRRHAKAVGIDPVPSRGNNRKLQKKSKSSDTSSELGQSISKSQASQVEEESNSRPVSEFEEPKPGSSLGKSRSAQPTTKPDSGQCISVGNAHNAELQISINDEAILTSERTKNITKTEDHQVTQIQSNASPPKTPDKSEGPPIPPRSSSLPQDPAQDPIITRKKKQKMFAPAQEEDVVPSASMVDNKKTENLPVEVIEGEPLEQIPDSQVSGNNVGVIDTAKSSSTIKEAPKKKNKAKKSKRSKASRNVTNELSKPEASCQSKVLPKPETPYMVDEADSQANLSKTQRQSMESITGLSSAQKGDSRIGLSVAHAAAQTGSEILDPIEDYYLQKNKHLEVLQGALHSSTQIDRFRSTAQEDQELNSFRTADRAHRRERHENLAEQARAAGYGEPSSSLYFQSRDPALARIDSLFEEEGATDILPSLSAQREGPVILQIITDEKENEKAGANRRRPEGPGNAQFAKVLRHKHAEASLRRSENNTPIPTESLEEEIDKVAAEQTYASILDPGRQPGDPSPIRRQRIEESKRLLESSPRRNKGTSNAMSVQQWDREAATFLREVPRLSPQNIQDINSVWKQTSSRHRKMMTDLGPNSSDVQGNDSDKEASTDMKEEASVIQPCVSGRIEARHTGRTAPSTGSAVGKAGMDSLYSRVFGRESPLPSGVIHEKTLTEKVEELRQRKEAVYSGLAKHGDQHLEVDRETLESFLADPENLEARDKVLKSARGPNVAGSTTGSASSKAPERLGGSGIPTSGHNVNTNLSTQRGGHKSPLASVETKNVAKLEESCVRSPISESSRTLSADPQDGSEEGQDSGKKGKNYPESRGASESTALEDDQPRQAFTDGEAHPSSNAHTEIGGHFPTITSTSLPSKWSTSAKNEDISENKLPSLTDAPRGNFESKKGGFKGGVRGKGHMHSKSNPWAIPGEEEQWGSQSEKKMTRRRASAGGSPKHVRGKGRGMMRGLEG